MIFDLKISLTCIVRSKYDIKFPKYLLSLKIFVYILELPSYNNFNGYQITFFAPHDSKDLFSNKSSILDYYPYSKAYIIQEISRTLKP